MKEVFGIHGIDTNNAFGRWIVYERDEDADPIVGPEKFSLLYIAGDGAATYAALYLENNIAPRALSIIRPGTGWGGNYSSYLDSDSVFHRIVNLGSFVPEYVFLGNNTLVEYKDFFK